MHTLSKTITVFISSVKGRNLKLIAFKGKLKLKIYVVIIFLFEDTNRSFDLHYSNYRSRAIKWHPLLNINAENSLFSIYRTNFNFRKSTISNCTSKSIGSAFVF